MSQLVGLGGLEPPTSRLSGVRSNQLHLPIRLPCYDFTPIIDFTLDGWLPKVTPPALGTSDFRGVTGGVYKARERIHRSMLTCDY